MSDRRDSPATREANQHIEAALARRLRLNYTTPELVFYRIDIDGTNTLLVVGGDGEGAYEWVVLKGGALEKHSDCGYGMADIALRDGLIFCFGLPPADGYMMRDIAPKTEPSIASTERKLPVCDAHRSGELEWPDLVTGCAPCRIAYLEAQESLLEEWQQRATKAEETAAEIQRPLDAQMARLNETVTRLNGENERLERELADAVARSAVECTPRVTDEMVTRFLCWKLPEDFRPDAGISFDPLFNVEYNARLGKPPQRHEPTGTNLFSADQAKAMLEHVLAVVPSAEAVASRDEIIEEVAKSVEAAPLTYAGPDPQGVRDLSYLIVAFIRDLKGKQ